MSLAKLWLQQERISEARDLLEPIYRWFEEGAATSDLTQARDFLTALR
jgi:predicted ATPase